MSKRIKLVLLNIIMIVIAIIIGFSFYSSLNFGSSYTNLENDMLEQVQEKLTNSFENSQTEKELVEKISEINQIYASEFILMKDNKTVYSTFPNIDVNSIRDIINQKAVLYKSQGNIVFQEKEYRLMYVIYHADAQMFINAEFKKLITFVIVVFFLFLLLSIMLMYSLYSPLFKINKAISKMQKLNFEEALDITGEDTVTQEFSHFVENLNEKMTKDSRKYTQLELVLLFEKQRLDFIVKMARGALHEIKTPIYQLLLKTRDESFHFDTKIQEADLSDILQRINLSQSSLQQDIKSLETSMEYFDVILLYRELEKEFYYLLDKKDVFIDLLSDEFIFINFNKMTMQYILHNLLSNITKYSLPNSEVRFEIFIEKDILKIKTENEATIENQKRILKNREINISEQDSYSSGVGSELISELINYFKGKQKTIITGQKVQIEITLPLKRDK